MSARPLILLLAATAFGLGACATGPAPYAAKTADSMTGYSDEALTATHYRVTYDGNAVTGRETVEDYLLYHAAEVTQRAGFHWFVFDTRSTVPKTTYVTDFDGWPGWRGYGWYWHNWDWGGPWGAPYEGSAESHPVTRYHAYAEIVLLTDDQAKSEPHALNAAELLAHLHDKVFPPQKDAPAKIDAH